MIEYTKPKSICKCGHDGDGLNSMHFDSAAHGHGACRVCKCKQFTWKTWTDEFRRVMLRKEVA